MLGRSFKKLLKCVLKVCIHEALLEFNLSVIFHKLKKRRLSVLLEMGFLCVECNKILDLMFVLDGSGSVGHDNFEIVKNWTKNVASFFDISNDFARLGVVQYSHFFTGR